MEVSKAGTENLTAEGKGLRSQQSTQKGEGRDGISEEPRRLLLGFRPSNTA